MISKIHIADFRSIESATVALGPLTVLYGPTSSGKSTLFYSLLAARNFILDPNRQADSFFNLLFMDLGGFEACVFNHDGTRTIGIAVTDEDVVLLLVDLDVKVASGTATGPDLALSGEPHPHAVPDAGRDLDADLTPGPYPAVAAAPMARVEDDLADPAADRAWPRRHHLA